MLDIKITKTTQKKDKPCVDTLGFGKYYTDHMFVMDYTEGKGWHSARVVPFENISLSPAAMVFHYAQEMFEGLKAYRAKDGRVLLFRPDKNIERMASTNERLCIPAINNSDVLDAIKAVVATDSDWIPEKEGTSLYIRPFIIATEAQLGVHPAHEYKFIVILSPVGSYYANGLAPVKICVEREYVRAVRGGTGAAKIGGNYAISLKGQEKAAKLGCSQSLWLDGVDRKYIDEVGAMNVFFVIGDEIVTPALDEGNILPGVTRRSCIEMLSSMGYSVVERKIAIDEVIEASKNGQLKEMFGTGTAAVISPVGELVDGDEHIVINNNEIGEISQKLYDTLTGIQKGEIEGPCGWSVVVK